MLLLMRNTTAAPPQTNIENQVLGAPIGRTLLGCSVLLVGFGHIAKELVPRLKPFGVRLLAVRQGPWGREGLEEDER